MKKLNTVVSALLSAGMVLGLAGCGETKQPTTPVETEAPVVETETPEVADTETETEADDMVEAELPGESGFEEINIGEEKLVGPYKVAAVYFQAVDMIPAGKNPSKEESDLHLEADIHLQDEYAVAYGFGSGEDIWPAYLTVNYEVVDDNNKVVADGSFMPMNADDGPHYGCNMKSGLLTVGHYTLKITILPPTDYLLHIDEETGVPAHEDAKAYFETQKVEFDWTYTGEQLQNE